MTKKKGLRLESVKAITDAPNLRDRAVNRCDGCAFFQEIEKPKDIPVNPSCSGICTKFKFETQNDWVCDTFEAEPPKVDAAQLGVEVMTAIQDAKQGKSLDDTLVVFGSGIKSLGNGRYGGTLIRFTPHGDYDLTGDRFDAATNYGFKAGESKQAHLFFHHAQPLKTKSGKQMQIEDEIGTAELTITDDGIEVIAQARKEYDAMLARSLKSLGWSSGTANHLVKREKEAKGYYIKRWLLGDDVSVTPTPAEARNAVYAMKALPKFEMDDALPTGDAGDTVSIAAQAQGNGTNNVKPTEGVKQMDEKEIKALVDAATKPLTDANAAQAAEVKALKDELTKVTDALKAEPPTGSRVQVNPGQKYPYKSIAKIGGEWDTSGLGEQLHDIMRAAKGMGVSTRLANAQDLAIKATKAALGGNESVPSEGGFAVQHDNGGWLAERTFAEAVIAPKCQAASVGPNANGVRFNDWDETSRADGSQYGGFVAYWAGEAASLTASAPKLREVDISLQKLTGLYYATLEEEEDAVALAGRIAVAFPKVMRWKVDNAILRGTGGSQPTGVIGHASTVSVTRSSASHIIAEDIETMWARMLASLLPGAEWYINQDCYPDLFQMAHAVGTGGIPVWLQPGGLSNAPYGALMGKKVNPIEQCSSLGTVGDILFANWDEYILAQKGAIQSASSIHVQFLTAQNCYRWMWRLNGRPSRSAKLTPANGSNDLGSVITLAT